MSSLNQLLATKTIRPPRLLPFQEPIKEFQYMLCFYPKAQVYKDHLGWQLNALLRGQVAVKDAKEVIKIAQYLIYKYHETPYTYPETTMDGILPEEIMVLNPESCKIRDLIKKAETEQQKEQVFSDHYSRIKKMKEELCATTKIRKQVFDIYLKQLLQSKPYIIKPSIYYGKYTRVISLQSSQVSHATLIYVQVMQKLKNR